ncbi:MAG: hypothetical protein ACM65L_13090 [Microcoleus sp.]
MVIGYWLFVICYLLLVVGSWLFVLPLTYNTSTLQLSGSDPGVPLTQARSRRARRAATNH